jgi:dynein heavy chain
LKYKETGTHIIKGLDDLMTTFEESSIKILALKNNTYAKYYLDRILRVEKELKLIVEALDEWAKVQKSWVYLEPIFSQQDIAEQMAEESKKFYTMDGIYRKEI